jgi:hypothetical protein
MNVLLALAARAIVDTADPAPSPVPDFTGDPNLVSPGIAGFIVTALIAVATVLLIIDMTRRMRRVRYRAEVRERLEAEKLDAELRALSNGEKPTGTKTAPSEPNPVKPAKDKPGAQD